MNATAKPLSDTRKQPPPLSQQFLQALHILINSARLYQDNNRLLVESVDRFVAIVRHLTKEEADVTLLSRSGIFYLQQDKLVYRKNATGLVQTLLLFFEKRGLGGLRFYPMIAEARLDQITRFARILDQSVQHENPAARLHEQLRSNQFSWVEDIDITEISVEETPMAEKTEPPDHEEPDQKIELEETKRLKKRKEGIKTYSYTILSLQEVAHKISIGRQAGINKPMRMIQNMVDMIIDDSNMFMSLSTIRDYDDYTFTHSINVAILSICLGLQIGLSKTSLETLGLSALFHDLGKIDIPKDILNKPDRLTDSEFKLMKQHSLNSVRRIIRLKTSSERKGKILLPPFEHHLKYDLSGYPQTPRHKPISLLGRIITIADVFDALTATRVYRDVALSPDRALGFMLEGSGKDFDPLLLKVFINMIGMYPVGTLLVLDHDEMGLVSKYNGESEQAKELWVLLLKTDEKGEFHKDREINLGQWNPKSGTFNRRILESLHPSAYGIQPAEFIL